MRARPASGARTLRTGARGAAWRGALCAAPLCALLLGGYPHPALASEGLNLFPDPRWLFIHFVILLVLIAPVRRWLLEPLAQVLEQREAKTGGASTRATELRDQASQLEAQVEDKLRQARAEAQRARATALAEAEAEERSILDTARAESARAVAEVRERIQRELEEARVSLSSQSEQLARDAASRILGRAL